MPHWKKMEQAPEDRTRILVKFRDDLDGRVGEFCRKYEYMVLRRSLSNPEEWGMPGLGGIDTAWIAGWKDIEGDNS